MPIFQIQRKQDLPAVQQSASTEPPPVAIVDDTKTTPEEDLKNAKQVTGEDPTSDKDQPTDKRFGLEQPGKELVLKVDGPLGRMFTDALNQVLAMESIVVMPMTEDDLRLRLEEQPDQAIVHVKAFNLPDVTGDDVEDTNNEVIHETTQENLTDFVIATESVQDSPKGAKNLGYLMELTRQNKKVKTTMSIRSAVSMIAERARLVCN